MIDAASPRLRAVFFGSPAFAVPCLRAVAAEALRVLSDDNLRPRYVSHLPAAPAATRTP